jgi:hypothetical protein
MLALRGGSPEGLAERAAPKRGITMSLRAIAGAGAGLFLTGLLLGPAAQAAPAVQLTGAQLASALLPASSFPSGYKIVKSGTYSSGRGLEHAPAKYHLATLSCKKYIVSGLPRTGFGETATAGSTVNNQRLGAYQQTVFQFASSGQAGSFYRQLYAFTVRCRSVTATFAGGTVKLTTQSLNKTHLGRGPAFLARQTLTATGFPATINDTMFTVAGTDVYVIDAAGQKPPSKPAVPAALLHLIARVQAAR